MDSNPVYVFLTELPCFVAQDVAEAILGACSTSVKDTQFRINLHYCLF